MPPLPKRPCTHPGCTALTMTGRCAAHPRVPWAKFDARGRQLSATERGYGAAWQKLRLIVLKRDGYLCRCDQCKGGTLRLTVANEVDHIESKAAWQRRHGSLAGVDDLSNLRAIARDCHQRKTVEERGGTYRKPVRIGLDGYAVDE